MALQALRSPLLPLAVGTAASLSTWQGSRVVAVAAVVYLLRSLWSWWGSLTIVINSMQYKVDFKAKPVKRLNLDASHGASKELRAKDGFSTPREGGGEACLAADAAVIGPAGCEEWAPFYPSLPFGRAQGAPIAGADCAPYWLDCEGSVFDVRNIRYAQTRQKVPSDPALYDCVGMDLIRDRRRIDALMDRLSGTGDLPGSHHDAAPWDPSWGVPRVFIVNCQLPYKAGNLLYGVHPEDDGGLSVLSYFVLSRDSCAQLSAGTESPALGLLRRFVAEGVSKKDGIAFKVMGRVEDLERHEVPSSFTKFNNKPVLLTGSAKVLSHRLPEVMEIDYDVRSWVYPARTALVNYHHLAREAELEIAYLVQGSTDDELPEQILGCFKVNDMDIMAAVMHSLM